MVFDFGLHFNTSLNCKIASSSSHCDFRNHAGEFAKSRKAKARYSRLLAERYDGPWELAHNKGHSTAEPLPAVARPAGPIERSGEQDIK
jgi:hypothetical protein